MRAPLATLTASADGNAGGGIIQIAILLLIPLAMYFLLIRPQRKRLKDQQAMQRALGVGDEVITSAGIYGFITGEEPDWFWLEIDNPDDGAPVQIRIAKAAVQSRVNAKATDAAADGKADAEAPSEPADSDD